MTTSAFLSTWSGSFVPDLVAALLGVLGLLLGLSMLVGYVPMATREH